MSRLPSLGPRGEGWVAAQLVLLLAIAVAGVVGPGWAGTPRTMSTLLGVVLLVAGLTMSVKGVTDLRDALTPLPYPREGSDLVERGVYARVRHPIYGGLIVGAFGWGLVCASTVALGLALVLLGFFELKSRREEVWLCERFPDYPAYRDRTRRFIPWVG